MFGNERVGILRGRFQRRQVSGIANVPERDADVSEKTSSFDPLNWRFAKHLPELLVGKRQVVAQWNVIRARSRLKCGFAGRFGKPVPWACIQAIVTAENSVADQRPQICRDTGSEFDR